MATVDLVFSAEKCEDLVKKAKEKVKLLRDWKDRAEGGTANFEEELGETLQYCSEGFEALRFHQQFDGYVLDTITLLSKYMIVVESGQIVLSTEVLFSICTILLTM